jgi:uncharacterized protein (TIGR03066 family)
MRVALSVILAFALAVSALAADIVGTWNILDQRRPMRAGSKFTMQFMKGGKMRMQLKDPGTTVIVDGTYSLKGNRLTLKMASQVINGKKQAPPTKEPGVFILEWKNKDRIFMTDSRYPQRVPAIMARIK